VSPTVDHRTDNAVTLREVDHALIDPHRTGYLITTYADPWNQSITSDDPDQVFMRAEHQVIGSFAPMLLEDCATCLEDFLSSDWLQFPILPDEDEGDLMVIPPPYLQRVTLRIRKVFHGVPSPIAFEE